MTNAEFSQYTRTGVFIETSAEVFLSQDKNNITNSPNEAESRFSWQGNFSVKREQGRQQPVTCKRRQHKREIQWWCDQLDEDSCGAEYLWYNRLDRSSMKCSLRKEYRRNRFCWVSSTWWINHATREWSLKQSNQQWWRKGTSSVKWTGTVQKSFSNTSLHNQTRQDFSKTCLSERLQQILKQKAKAKRKRRCDKSVLAQEC